ncbi:methylenetetrahydrofolate reductase [Qaidamihabitans albus]|uniref:methylenetetrahydrofolate reductase n=1 Tax=Qaidamihabitans albus TaxID=2795733 RepID=UPI0018F21ECE|nr:methylenetetrahydrofolate reductase [Qaidamihabitans albus]
MEQLFTRRSRDRRAAAPLLARPRYEVLPLPAVLEETGALPEQSVVTVTASPRLGVGATLDICEKLAAQRLHAVPHLAARQLRDLAELSDVLGRLAGAGIDEVFVIGGDARDPSGSFADGLSLLRGMAELGRLPARIGVPSYPEGHPVIGEAELWSALRAKQDYADYTVTQLCFDAGAVCRFVAAARGSGITLPVVAGVPGVVDTRVLLKVGLRIGVGDSMRFLRGHGSAAGRLLRPGGYRPGGLVRELGARAAQEGCDLAGLHFYTFNRVGRTARWVDQTHRRAA